MAQLMGVGVGDVYDPYAQLVSATDAGAGTESLNAPSTSTKSATDTITGTDTLDTTSIYYYVNSDWELEPLGVSVLADRRDQLVPSTRDYIEEVPERHGVIDFGTDFKARLMELKVGIEAAGDVKADLRRYMAKYLSPLAGEVNLVFFDEPDRTYWVKYSGDMWLVQKLKWIEFVIPFRMNTPFLIRTFAKTLTGSGTLTNNGTFETPITIAITGVVVNPSVTVGTDVLTWTGTVAAGKQLVIDTDAQTVIYDGANGLGTYSGVFPKLAVGNTSFTAAAAGTTLVTWRDRWL